MNLWLKEGYYIIEYLHLYGFIHKCTLKFVHQRVSRNPAKSHGIAGYKTELAELLLKKWMDSSKERILKGESSTQIGAISGFKKIRNN